MTIKFKEITTLKVGGKITYYFEVKNKKELKDKISFAKNRCLPIFVIGSGSDIAVSDKTYNGVVIKYLGNKIVMLEDKVIAESGAIWDELVLLTVTNGLQGIESMSGIPGTVGASPIQNIGAYGQELSEIFVSLVAYDIKSEKFVKFNKKDCKFGYRESIFKKKSHWQKFVITEVTLQLKKANKKDLLKIRNDVLTLRKQKLEDPELVPNAGSFFKNPFITLNKKLKFENKYADMQFYPVENKFKISAGYLIEKAGWKGKSLGLVKVSSKHALIITNPDGKGRFKDIKKLADIIIRDVYKIFGIKLEPEVQYINC